ncbi:hypothetical protein [Methylonatrum kenyense]|uniref:hypothetical protein n=1 Tax=Methylonatrum kenyense TaxID=455253 RepID=UPI0024A78C21|nr:hypothetical protein [Methylonatrum kenyense]
MGADRALESGKAVMGGETVEPQTLIGRLLARPDAYAAAGLLAAHPDFADHRLLRMALPDRATGLVFAGMRFSPACLLEELGGWQDSAVQRRLAGNPATPAPVIARLLDNSSADPDVGPRLAAHVRTPTDALPGLVADGRLATRVAAAGHPGAGHGLLLELAGRGEMPVLRVLSARADLSTALLARIWERGDRHVQAELLRAATCPRQLLAAAAHAPHALWRRRAAGHPALPEPVRWRLLRDSDARVRAAVAEAPTTPVELLHRFQADPAQRVRIALARRQDLPPSWLDSLARQPGAWLQRWVARNPCCPRQMLERLAQSAAAEVRRAVSRNPATSAFMLARLAADADPWVRAGAAGRADLYPSVLARLADDTEVDVLGAVAANPSTPAERLAGLAMHDDRDVRRAVAQNPAASAAVLAPLATDPYPLNRFVVSQRDALSLATLEALAGDPEPRIRFIAWKRLGALAASH